MVKNIGNHSMSGDQPSGKAPERTGSGAFRMYFVYAGVAVLCYVFGWVVLAVFLCLMTLAWLFAYFWIKSRVY